jgi:hypothetical protein
MLTTDMRKTSVKNVDELLDQNYTIALLNFPFESKYLRNLLGNDSR